MYKRICTNRLSLPLRTLLFLSCTDIVPHLKVQFRSNKCKKHVLTNLKNQEYEHQNVFSQLDQSHQNRLVWTHPHKGAPGNIIQLEYLLQLLARPGIILIRTVASHLSTCSPLWGCSRPCPHWRSREGSSRRRGDVWL